MDQWRRTSYLLLLVCLLGASAEVARYDNYRVYQIVARSLEHMNALHALEYSSDSLIFIESGRNVGDKFTIIVAPHKQADFVETMDLEGISVKLVEKNIQRTFDEEHQRMSTKRRTGVFDWTEYQELEDIHAWLDKLAQEYTQVEVLEGGHSYENRTIKGVKVSFQSGNPGIFIEGGIHAREWISPATVTYILNEVLTSEDPQVRKIAESFDWYFFPSVNPDGYVYTHKKDRLWRKTRTPYSGGCFGADPNRNWDFHWAEQGTSTRCNSDTYGGPHAFSEVETKSLSDFVASLKGKIHAYIAFHSYSQLLLFPYGHTIEHTPNHNDLNEIAKTAVDALAKRYGTKYTYGNIYEAIYPASGASADWAYGKLDVKIAYTYELRPGSSSWNGFVLPAKEIIPTGQETLDSLVALLEESSRRGYYETSS